MLWKEFSALRTDFNKPGSADLGFYFDSSNTQDYNDRSELPGALLFAGLQVPVFYRADRRCAGNYCNGRKNGPEHAGRRLEK